MEVMVSLSSIQDLTSPFVTGQVIEVSLHLSVIHLFHRRSEFRRAGLRKLALDEPNALTQPGTNAAYPNLTYLRSKLTDATPMFRPDEGHGLSEKTRLDRDRTKVFVESPLKIQLGFRNLQAGPWGIPLEIGEEIFALGELWASALKVDQGTRVKVRQVYDLDLHPGNSTFGSYVPVPDWQEWVVDVSNISTFQPVIAKLEILA